MARLPLRVFGLFLLTLSLSVASCQAFIHTLSNPTQAPTIDQRSALHD